MSENAQVSWQQAKLLNAYYRRVGLAAVGQGSCPRFVKFRAGYDESLIGPSTEQGVPTVADIPPGMTEIKNPFYTGTVTATFSGDTALCTCEIPKGAVSEPKKFNVIGIYDVSPIGETTETVETLVAACTTLVDWITPTELDRSYLSVAFPIEGVDGE